MKMIYGQDRLNTFRYASDIVGNNFILVTHCNMKMCERVHTYFAQMKYVTLCSQL